MGNDPDGKTADMLKGEFLSDMSHDLRTPLNGITGMADLLLRSRLDERQREWAETIAYSSQMLLELIGDIIDLSKIEAGEFQLETGAFDLKSLMAKAASILKPHAGHKGLALSIDYPAGLQTKFLGDAARIRQTFMKLADNAIKFTEEGGVRVKVSAGEALPDGRIPVKVEVSDTGIGIDKDAMERIFERVRQTGGSTTRKYAGAGLGLPICKKLVELMGGAIGAESSPGKGSTFHFTLPLQPAPPDAIVEDYQTEADAAPARYPDLKILLVDDNQVNRLVAQALLSQFGCKAEEIDNGADSIERALAGRYDIVFMDCQMPGMDGYEATMRIREREAGGGRRTLITAMTANVMRQDKDRCKAAGMDDFIAKPVSYDDLRAFFARRFADRAQTPLPSEPAKAPEKMAEEPGRTSRPEVIDLEFLISNVNGDPAVLADIVEALHADYDEKVVLIAADLRNSDMAALKMHCHALKGSAGAGGAKRLADVARRIETLAKSGAAQIPEDEAKELASAKDEFIKAVDAIDWQEEVSKWSRRQAGGARQ